MNQYYVCNLKGKLQRLNRMFDSVRDAKQYFDELVKTYPSIHFEIRKNPSYGGAFEKIVTETEY